VLGARVFSDQNSLEMPYPRAAIQMPFTATASPIPAIGQVFIKASPAFLTMGCRSQESPASTSSLTLERILVSPLSVKECDRQHVLLADRLLSFDTRPRLMQS
jgi:hypothetical protein